MVGREDVHVTALMALDCLEDDEDIPRLPSESLAQSLFESAAAARTLEQFLGEWQSLALGRNPKLEKTIQLHQDMVGRIAECQVWILEEVLDRLRKKYMHRAWARLSSKSRSPQITNLLDAPGKAAPPPMAMHVGGAVVAPTKVPPPPLGKVAPPPLGKAVMAPPVLGSTPLSVVGKSTAPSLPPTATGKSIPPCLPFASKAPALPSSGKSAPPAFPGKSAPPTFPGKSAPPAFPGKSASGGKSAAPAFPGGPGPPGKAPSVPFPVGAAPVVSFEPLVVFPCPSIDSGGIPFETRKVHWQSIPVSRFKESVFHQRICGATIPVQVDYELVKSHFVKLKQPVTPMTKERKSADAPPTAAGTPVQSPSVPIVSLLESKRIQQIEIFLNGKKFLNRDFLEGVMKGGGPSTLPPASLVELLESTLALYPSAEERDVLAKSSGPPNILAKADSFLTDISVTIPEFRQAAAVHIILLTFDEVQTELEKYFSRLVGKIRQILESQNIVKTFFLIGSFVTYLGGDTSKKPPINGFGLENLAQMKKIHAFDRREYSLVDCLGETLCQNGIFDDLVTSDLDALSGLLECDFADMVQRSVDLEKSVRENLSKVKFKNVDFYDNLVREILPQFLHRALPLVDQLHDLREQSLASAHAIRVYFGENEKRTLNEILACLHHLRTDLVKSRGK